MSTNAVEALRSFTRTIVQTLEAMTFACTYPGCQRTNLAPGKSYVPDMLNLYLGIRKGPVELRHPLTASELASEVRCFWHPLEHGIQMYPLLTTAKLMDRLVAENVERLEKEQRQKSFQPRQPRPEPPRGSFVNSILSQKKPVTEKPRPKYRTRTRRIKPVRPLDAPKRYGNEPKPFTAELSNKKKKKGKKNKGSKKGEGNNKIKGR